MDVVIADEIVETDYGQVDLLWSPGGGFDGDWQRFFAGQVNGLVGAADPGTVYFHLGRRSGGSAVRMVLHSATPEVDLAWEDIVEVSTLIPEGADVRWATWAGENSAPLDELQPGIYRLRVSATGRDAGRADEFAEAVIDTYLVEFWSEPALRPDDIIRVGSADAEYWHREWGGNQ